jgi:hypothetical protein
LLLVWLNTLKIGDYKLFQLELRSSSHEIEGILVNVLTILLLFDWGGVYAVIIVEPLSRVHGLQMCAVNCQYHLIFFFCLSQLEAVPCDATNCFWGVLRLYNFSLINLCIPGDKWSFCQRQVLWFCYFHSPQSCWECNCRHGWQGMLPACLELYHLSFVLFLTPVCNRK